MTDSELSNKRKRDTSEVNSQPDNAFQPRKRIDFNDYKILRPDNREDVRILPSQKHRFPGILLQIGVLQPSKTLLQVSTRRLEPPKLIKYDLGCLLCNSPLGHQSLYGASLKP